MEGDVVASMAAIILTSSFKSGSVCASERKRDTQNRVCHTGDCALTRPSRV